ncbi:hypothetical protein [Hymenobacter sp. PAMC 26628]|uniref:hypothetical protein n=1 Tax=Hymenobacter sp. PAMC 26628 TaxID=1484118 RepID=UPI000AE6ABAF|nr:hypothetical protein [Hymenobacter sp. PAMC 26628]
MFLGIRGSAQSQKPLPPGYLQWSATRRLQASDFQLRVRPQNNLNQGVGNLGIEINRGIADLFGKSANRTVQNLFQRTGSYLDSTDRLGTACQIRYMQMLWDINEVAARRLRQQLRANAKRIILMGKPDVNDLFRATYESANQRQIQYADETKYGLFLDKQKAWKKQIENELLELSAFAIPD